VIPDTKRGNYYVSAINDAGKVALLAGPYLNDHAAALAAVGEYKAKAMDVDPRAPWYAYGTCRLPLDVAAPKGRLS